MHRLLSARDGSLEGRSVIEFLPADDLTEVLSEFEKRERQSADTTRAEHRLEADDRRHRVGRLVDLVGPRRRRQQELRHRADAGHHQAQAAEDALRAQAELSEYQALHDSLTDLPNRTLFRDRLGQAIEAVRRQKRSAAVLMIDLDGFKEIND